MEEETAVPAAGWIPADGPDLWGPLRVVAGGGARAGDVNETITTFCGPEEFRLHIRTLLVM